MSKCEFGKTSLVYLSHIVGGGELKIDPSKVDVIVNWPKSKTFTEVRSFLGATQHWRKFIANFSLIVIIERPKPLEARPKRHNPRRVNSFIMFLL